MASLVETYNKCKYDFLIFLHLYRRIKKEGLSKEDIENQWQISKTSNSVKEELNYVMNVTRTTIAGLAVETSDR